MSALSASDEAFDASLVAYIRQNLRNPLTIENLAAVANLSPRQFSRAFLAETGQSPAKAVERLRLETARFMMEEGRHTVNVVAEEVGFADRERMRRAFLRTFGVPPEVLRRNARREAVTTACQDDRQLYKKLPTASDGRPD
ncbi:transcriptional regulator GlxA family with amidase domain [Bradyrhizobium sp. GM24.11]